MNLEQIEERILHLSTEEKAELAQRILLSLDFPLKNKVEFDWLSEARRRAEDLDQGYVQPISAEEVKRKAELLLR